jgi:acyl-CoA synthetase (AMP-forming)/AMP-acid ligase II
MKSRICDIAKGQLFDGQQDVKLVIEHSPTDRQVVTRQDLEESIAWASSESELTTVRDGCTVAIEAEHSLAFIGSLYACLRLGLPVAPLPSPSDPVAAAAARHRIASTVSSLCPEIGIGSSDFRHEIAVSTKAPSRWSVPPDTAIIQYTSGSTSDPKGCALSHEAIAANIESMGRAYEFSEGSVMASFLPFHHDMGLFASLLGPLSTSGALLHLLPTKRFALDPRSFIRLLSDVKATHSAMPAAALSLVTRVIRRTRDIDLSSLESLSVGAEPIRPAIAAEFLETTSDFGFAGSNIFPSYGLAEATLAVTFSKGLRVLYPNSEKGKIGYTSLGVPVIGTSLRIVDAADTSQLMPEGGIGLVEIVSKSQMSGYLTSGGFHPLDGPLLTKDLGFVLNGQIALTGRCDDVMMLGGHNIFPDDVEWAVKEAIGISGRAVAALPSEGSGGGMRILAEMSGPQRADRDLALVQRIEAACVSVCGFRPSEVVFLRPGSLPKTTSGKLQRRASSQAYASGQFEVTWHGR